MAAGDLFTLVIESGPQGPWAEQNLEWWSALRPRDLLVLRIGLRNLDVISGVGGTRTLRPRDSNGGYLLLELPPQSTGEEAFALYDLARRDSALPVRARRSGPTRLLYRVRSSIPFTLESLLGAEARTPVIDGRVDPSEVPPADLAPTFIEAPYRLFLTPDGAARWRSTTPADGNVQPLWQLLLQGKRLYAVRSRPEFPDALRRDDPFLLSIPRDKRVALEARSSEWPDHGVRVDRLALSALGADLNLRGAWVLPDNAVDALIAWQHDAVLGRDVRVELVSKAFLFPFGHQVSYIRLTERRFVQAYSPNQAPPHRERRASVGYLEQRIFIVRVDEWRDCSASNRMPFRKVRLVTSKSPNIRPAPSENSGESFWPRLDIPGANPPRIELEFEGVDWDGRTIPFRTPCVVVFGNRPLEANAPVLARARDRHRESPPEVALGGREVALHRAVTAGDTSMQAVSMSFEVEDGDLRAAITNWAKVESAGLAGLGQRAPTKIEILVPFPETDKIGRFARVIDAVQELDFGKLKAPEAGVLAQPRIKISGFSSMLGLVGGELSGSEFDPAAYFKDAMPKLFGVLPLDQVLRSFPIQGLDELPRLTWQGAKACYTWQTDKVQSRSELGFKALSGSTLTMSACAEVSASGAPRIETRASLTRFSLGMPPKAPVVELLFERIAIRTRSGEKPELDVALMAPIPIRFMSPLDFISPLMKWLENLLGGGLSLQLKPDAIGALTRFNLPSIGVGVFSIRNLALQLELDLPFGARQSSSPSFSFGISSHRRPFQLQVGIFGGGGFFAVKVGLDDGSTGLEGAIEFGGMAVLDIGVARGSVYLVAGIWFVRQGNRFSLTGYIRCGGNLDVLGLISVSVEFYLALTYSGGALEGEARMTVEISVLFFSVTVELRVHRRLAGGGPQPQALEGSTIIVPDRPPSFAECFDRDEWRAYWYAFAPLEA